MKRIEERIGHLLRKMRATISVAESCTGGLIAHRITNVAGSSDYFESAVVSYSNQTKVELLRVPQSLIDQHGPVSEAVAREMAEGIREGRKTTIGLAATGVAGPSGGTPEVPVGTVFIALATPDDATVKRFHFPGRRIQIKELAAEKALEMVLEYCNSHEATR
ncbi:MAG: nicotinamide-nucleotide amidohydrolase family protein [Proteobacteria bacterium]|nr:nicotinamide-nucleotide amidohydrolase family protein [Pseudomonadota bacterium]